MAPQLRGRRGRSSLSEGALLYFSVVQDRSHWELFWDTTPLTFADWIRGCLSQIHGIAGAWAVTCLSISAQAAARSRPGQLGLVHRLVDRLVVELGPVRVALLRGCSCRRTSARASSGRPRSPAASRRSGRSRPSAAACCSSACTSSAAAPGASDLEAHLLEVLLGDLGRLGGHAHVGADHQELLGALVLAGGEARLLEVLGGDVRQRLAVGRQEVHAGALHAAGLLEAGRARRDEVRGDVADGLAAAVRRIALRSKPAMTALRTLMSSNGLIVLFSAIQRPPTPGQLELVLLVVPRLLEVLRQRREVAVDHALAVEDAARGDAGSSLP